MQVGLYEVLQTDTHHPRLQIKESLSASSRIDKPEAVVEFLNTQFHLDKQIDEFVYLITTTASLMPTAVFLISKGTFNMSAINQRDLFIPVLLTGACTIFIAHNHPSSRVTPSSADNAIFKRIKEVADTLGVILCDFLIIGEGYYSYKESGELESSSLIG